MFAYAVLTTVSDRPGVLFGLTKALADHQADVTYVDIIRTPANDPQIYLEFRTDTDLEPVIVALREVPGV